MSVASIIVFSVLVVLTTWLLIDTIIYVVKRIKEKKRQKQSGDEVVDNDKQD